MAEIPVLPTAIDNVLDAVDTLLRAEIKTDGLLEGVRQVGRMSYELPSPPFPGVWYYAGTMKPVSKNGVRNRWRMPVVLASLTFSDNPQKGSEDATRIAAAAQTTLLKSGNLTCSCVSLTEPESFEPAAPIDRKQQMYSALAMVMVEFTALR